VSAEPSVYRQPGFLPFLAARVLAMFAVQIMAVVVAWQVYDLTRDPMSLAYVGLAQFLPMLFLLLPAGDLIGWKRCGGHIVKLLIPADARRTASLVGRKCRAEFVKVLEIDGADEAVSGHDGATVYRVGEVVRPDSYDDNPLVECTHGIHWFATRAEAEEY